MEQNQSSRRGGVMMFCTRRLPRLCLVSILVFLVFIAIITLSARIVLPFLVFYKPTLEDKLSEFLKSPVTIAELDARWEGTGPILRARGVQISDPMQRQAQFDELLIDLNVPRSILSGTPVMDELTLVGADLVLDLSRDHRVELHGVNSDRAAGSQPPGPSPEAGTKNTGLNAVAWLSTATRVGVLDAQVTLQLPDESTLMISDLNVRVEKQGGVHQVRMDMQLPPELGGAFEIGADLNGVSDLSKVGGEVYVKAADFQAAGINRVLGIYDIELPALEALAERGTNAELELWAQLDEGAVLRVNGRTAIGQSAVDDPNANSLFGDLLWAREVSGGWRFSATDVVVGRRGEETTFDEIHIGSAEKTNYKPQWILLRTAETRVQPVINTITKLLPSAVPEAVSNWLETASLSASIRRAEMQMSLLNREESFSLVAQLDDTQWQPSKAHPGVSIESMDINILNGRGQIQMPGQTIEVMPFVQSPEDGSKTVVPVALELEQVAWSAQLDLSSRSLKGGLSIHDRGATVALRHSLAVNSNGVTEVDVQGQFAADSVFDVKRWFTQTWMPPATREWLEDALQGGEVRNGTIEVFGTLDELTDQTGESNESSVIRAEFDARDATLKFLESWPEARSVDAHLIFDRTSLNAQVNSGELSGVRVDSLVANIDNLLDAELFLSIVSTEPLSALANFATTGPLKNILEPVLGGAEVDGPARLEVEVLTPLSRPNKFDPKTGELIDPGDWPVAVKGNVFLQDSNIKLAAVDLPLKNVRGPIGFNERGVELKTVQATLFGASVRLNAASVGEGVNHRTDIAVRGVLPARSVLERYDIVGAEYVSGNSSWRADATIPHDIKRLAKQGIALTVTSDLVGTALSLAEPLGKRSGEKLPLRVSTRFRASDKAQVWHLLFGTPEAVVNDIRVAVTDEGMEGLIMKLGGSLGDMQPEEGIRVMGSADVLSLDGLVTDIGDIIDSLSDPESDSDAEREKILPLSVDVYGRKFQVGNSYLGDASVKVNTDDKFVNLYINNAHLRGSVRYPREHWRKDIESKVRLNYADRVLIDALSEDTGDDNNGEPAQRLDPTTLPPIDLHISRFDWDQLTLQNIVARTEPEAAGLRINTLGFATGTTQLIGEGLWHLVDPQNVNPNLANDHRAQLHLTLQSSDFGTALEEFGFPGVMANGEGEVKISLNWPDALYSPELENVAGLVTLDIKRGQLLQIDPGAGRLVGLFALQTLPRRLNLDFDDLVLDGLDFSTISGEISTESGIADIRFAQINGPVGVVSVSGTTNLVTQELNQKVIVLPRVSGALPIIGVIAGGATAGVGALIAGGILKGLGVDFDRIGLREYSITGSFSDPKIEQN